MEKLVESVGIPYPYPIQTQVAAPVAPYGYDGGLNSIATAALLFGGLGGRGYGYGAAPYAGVAPAVAPIATPYAAPYAAPYYPHAGDIAAKTVELQNISDTRFDVKGTESGIRETILNQNLGQASEFRTLHDRISGNEKETIRAQYEGKIASLESQNQLSNKVDYHSNAINRQVFENQVATDKQFFTNQVALDKHFSFLENRMNDKFVDVQSRESSREISFLKDELNRQRDINQTNNTITAILAGVKALLPVASTTA